jgi:hypothetical protein
MIFTHKVIHSVIVAILASFASKMAVIYRHNSTFSPSCGILIDQSMATKNRQTYGANSRKSTDSG